MNETPEDTPLFFVDPRLKESLFMQPPLPMALHVTWGDASIIFHQDGRLVVEGCPTMDAAAIAFWRAVVRWTPAGMQVILPDGYGEKEPA